MRLRLLGAGILALIIAMPSLAVTNYYVATNGPGGAFTNWATAASNIQDAIDRTLAGDVVWVSNGVYNTGGITNAGGYPSSDAALTNRVMIFKAITVRSANNDPIHTVIVGAGPKGPAAVRCVYMIANSSLIGFTLTNGATLSSTGLGNFDRVGGGVCSSTISLIISNCVITGNSAGDSGGGAYCGTLYNCLLFTNSSIYGGGARNSTLYNCTVVSNTAPSGLGGGVNNCIMYNCLIIGNAAIGNAGGGVVNGSLYNCTVVGNSATFGGGVADGSLYNCTVVGNSATFGNGVYGGKFFNCIVYFNGSVNWYDTTSIFTNSCTYPTQTTWIAENMNITNDPVFVAKNYGNYRLSQGSPCINAGLNQSWMNVAVDLDGHSRIDRFSGMVDMGCYEYLNSGMLIMVPGLGP
jgi:hypothetical protein